MGAAAFPRLSPDFGHVPKAARTEAAKILHRHWPKLERVEASLVVADHLDGCDFTAMMQAR